MTAETQTLEERLSKAGSRTDVFDIFAGRVVERLEQDLPVAGSEEFKEEIISVGKRFMSFVSKQDITGITFGCGCEERTSKIVGTYKTDAGEQKVDVSDYVMSYGEGGSAINGPNHPQVIILNMFAGKNGFGCSSQRSFPKLYDGFIGRLCIEEAPEMYRALAKSPEREKFERYFKFEEGEWIQTPSGIGAYTGTVMDRKIASAVESTIGLKETPIEILLGGHYSCSCSGGGVLGVGIARIPTITVALRIHGETVLSDSGYLKDSVVAALAEKYADALHQRALTEYKIVEGKRASVGSFRRQDTGTIRSGTIGLFKGTLDKTLEKYVSAPKETTVGSK